MIMEEKINKDVEELEIDAMELVNGGAGCVGVKPCPACGSFKTIFNIFPGGGGVILCRACKKSTKLTPDP